MHTIASSQFQVGEAWVTLLILHQLQCAEFSALLLAVYKKILPQMTAEEYAVLKRRDKLCGVVVRVDNFKFDFDGATPIKRNVPASVSAVKKHIAA